MVRHHLLWAQCNLGSLRAVHVPGRLNQGSDMLSQGSMSSGEWILFRRLILKLLLPNIFLQGTGHAGLGMAQGPPVCLSLGHSALLGHQMDQMLSSTGGSTLVKPVMVPRSDSAVIDSSLVNSAEQRPPLASEGLLVASPTQNVESIFVAPRQEPLQLPVKVANTIAEVRAQSTRCLYPIKTSLSSPTGVPFEMKTHPLVR